MADRFKNDIPWRLSLLANGHTPQSVALYIERSLMPVVEQPLPRELRQQRFEMVNFFAVIVHVCVCLCTCVRTCMRACVHACVRVNVCLCVC